ncbi:MAG: PAS domain S-box protein [Candidatus Eiseniibacteriota bacterium]|nr:MAG: PAS domain S-box protein [Candidatus Eisenbacteria bacterium]
MSSMGKQQAKSDSVSVSHEICTRLLEGIPIPLVLLDHEGKVMFLNKAMEELSGYSAAEAKGVSFVSSFIPERERAKEREIIESLVWLQQPATHTSLLLTKGGYETIQEWTALCLPDPIGRASAVAFLTGCKQTYRNSADPLTGAGEFLEFVLESLNAGLALIDRDRKIVRVCGGLREQFRQCVGRPCYESFGASHDVCPNCPAKLIFDSEREVLSGKREGLLQRSEVESVTGEWPARCGYSKLIVLPVTDNAGELVGIAELTIGNHEERLLQEWLRVAQESLNTFLSHSPDGILIADPTTDVILDANQQACRVLRTEKDALVGSPASEVFPPEWRAEYKQLVSQKLLKNGDLFQESTYVTKGDSPRVPVELLVVLADPDSGRKRLQMMFRDVSKERYVQGQLKSQASLLHNVNDAIISVDMDETLLFLNKKAEALYGWKAEEAICRPLYDLIRYEFTSPSQEQDYRRALEEEGHWAGDVVHHHKDGHAISVATSVSTVTGDDGTPTGLVMVNRDITETKQSQAELKRRANEMIALYEIGQAISTHLSLKDVLSVIHAQVGRLMRARNFYIALLDETREEVRFPIYVDELVMKNGTSRKAGKGYTEYVIHLGEPVLLSDEVEHRMVEAGYEGVGPRALSWLGVPLTFRQKTIGMMAVQSYTKANLYDEDDIWILSAISDMAAIAIANARMFEQVRSSEERYRDILENMSEGYVVIQDGRIAFANRAFAELSSYAKERLLGREFCEILSSESQSIIENLFKRKSIGPEEEILSRLTLVSKDGEETQFQCDFRSLSYDGKPALIGVCPKSTTTRVSVSTEATAPGRA